MNEDILLYYSMLILGLLFFIVTPVVFVVKYRQKEVTYKDVIKLLITVMLGIILLTITLPSLKFMVLQDYAVSVGPCTVDIDGSGKTPETVITFTDTDQLFSFREVPDLDDIEESTPYYCEVLTTKDHLVSVSYKIYDDISGNLLYSSQE